MQLRAANPILSLNYAGSCAKLSRVFDMVFQLMVFQNEGFAHEQSYRQEREKTSIALYLSPFIRGSIIPQARRRG